jgi:hypothetical protein
VGQPSHPTPPPPPPPPLVLWGLGLVLSRWCTLALFLWWGCGVGG